MSPRSQNIPHVRRRFNTRHKFQHHIRNTHQSNYSTNDLGHDIVVYNDGPQEYVKNATSNEGEEERCIACDLRRDLELEESDCWCALASVDFDRAGASLELTKTKNDNIGGDYDLTTVKRLEIWLGLYEGMGCTHKWNPHM